MSLSFKDVSLGIPKSDILGVTVALIHVAAQQLLAVWNGLRKDSKLDFENCLCRTPAAGHEAVFLYSKVMPHFWIEYRWYIRYIAMRWFSVQMPRDASEAFPRMIIDLEIQAGLHAPLSF